MRRTVKSPIRVGVAPCVAALLFGAFCLWWYMGFELEKGKVKTSFSARRQRSRTAATNYSAVLKTALEQREKDYITAKARLVGVPFLFGLFTSEKLGFYFW